MADENPAAESPAPAAPPAAVASAPEPEKPAPKWWKPFRIVTLVVVAIAMVVLLLAQLGRGRKVMITDKEEVYYTSGASKEDALKLGQALKDVGYFDTQTAKSVQVAKNGQTVVVKFVVNSGAWGNEETVLAFGVMRTHLGEKIFAGQPVEVRLCDDHFNTKKTLK